MPTNKEEQKNQRNPFLKYIGLATQMGGIIYLGNLIGVWLDENYSDNSGIFQKSVTLVAVFLSIYQVIRQVTKDSND